MKVISGPAWRKEIKTFHKNYILQIKKYIQELYERRILLAEVPRTNNFT